MSLLFFGLIGGLSGRLIFELRSFGWTVGLIVGLSGALISGGMFALKHFVLRLFLWIGGSAPLRYVAFLAQAKDLLFLRQVGGGYIFVHRLLREYFVSLAGSEKTANTLSGYGQDTGKIWYIEQRLARQARASPEVSTKRSSRGPNMLFAGCGFGRLARY
jgi:hypothetical protein